MMIKVNLLKMLYGPLNLHSMFCVKYFISVIPFNSHNNHKRVGNDSVPLLQMARLRSRDDK